MGILFANLPLCEFIREGGNGEPAGLLKTFQSVGMETDIFPLLIFLGVGADTDFSPMLSNPKTLLLGAGAQAGVFVALLGALLLGMTDYFEFGLLEASSIGIIGGADGLAAEIGRRGDMVLGFGPQTWPHMMVRVMLAEQLYRAQTILAGHPYHRD